MLTNLMNGLRLLSAYNPNAQILIFNDCLDCEGPAPENMLPKIRRELEANNWRYNAIGLWSFYQ